MEHSHCQLIGLPIIPPLISWELDEAKAYYEEEDSCVYCDTLKQELETKEHIFLENEYAVALTPFASRSPFEVWVLPKEHSPRYEEVAPSSVRGISDILGKAVKRLAEVLDRPAYNFYLHNSPLQNSEIETNYYHYHFEIVPRITNLGGFEWGTGFYINVVSPEEAAKALKEAPEIKEPSPNK